MPKKTRKQKIRASHRELDPVKHSVSKKSTDAVHPSIPQKKALLTQTHNEQASNDAEYFRNDLMKSIFLAALLLGAIIGAQQISLDTLIASVLP